MIRISCTNLEQVRVAPAQHGKMIATIEKPKSSGRRGMFTCWQEAASSFHTTNVSVSETVKLLQKKFMQFDENLVNSRRQAKLADQLTNYCALYEKSKFEFIDSKHHMNWDIVAGVRLTGNTPWVVHNSDGYFSFIPVEQPIDWQTQLRFPLIQQYLSSNHIECDVTEMRVGVYCLTTNKFEFKVYSTNEIQMFISETGEIFQTVLDEFNKWKK